MAETHPDRLAEYASSRGGQIAHNVGSSQKIFKEGLGKVKDFKAKIHVEADATSKFCKARPVPYSMKVKIEEELDRLLSLGILKPVQFSEWAMPIVPVLKSDRSVRICGDFKVTVNPVAKLDCYPIPRIEDLLATLGGGKSFTKLDMSQAYQQVELEESSKKFTVINTHKGLFEYTRLPFGISSAPAIFERVMEGLLQNIPGVVVYIDDVLITGKTDEDHLQSLETVLKRMEDAGMLLKKDKCCFMTKSVSYLGYIIDAEGLHPTKEKLQAIRDTPSPKNLTQLKSYLGLLSYYGRFLPNLSNFLFPLYRLLRRQTPWTWSKTEEETFQNSKKLLMSSKLLVRFDPSLELILACDASNYGIGAVLAHCLPDGLEKPIGFSSRTLTETEKRYSQLEKEGLACIFGIKKFHSYLFGHPFTIYTDNLPLKSLFCEKQAVPAQAAGRIQRWALILANYEYKILFRPTHKHSNADALSRLPSPTTSVEEPVPTELILLMEAIEKMPITEESIKDWTQKDPTLSRIYKYIQNGWPNQCPEELKQFVRWKSELSTLNGCILFGSRVLVPPPGRKQLLLELHQGHPGISRMKSLARMYLWWPGMDSEIEKLVKKCSKCQENQRDVPSVPLKPWSLPSRPWNRLHIDYVGPFMNSMFLLIIDAHSKWVEIFKTSSTTSAATIQLLRSTFFRFGIPQTIVSDDGSCFTSSEFEEFLKLNGINHLLTAPYHPQSNGLAERMVQAFKCGMKKLSEGTIDLKLARFLFNY